jgi:hypothetical protein
VTVEESLRFLDPEARDDLRKYAYDSVGPESAQWPLRWRNVLELKILG